MSNIGKHLMWLAIAIFGAFSLGVVALTQGESINALWIVTAAISIYLIAYRFYALYIAKNVMRLDANRLTPGRAFE
jgi:hypothetical protein